MADTFTPAWNLTMPEVGASRDSWGAKLNANMQTIDRAMGAAMPIGAMLDYAGVTAPAGWLLCDGTLRNISQYPRLFAIISNRHGGDGVTTFGTPDSRCRVLVGVGSNIADALGQVFTFALAGRGGANGQAIAQVNLPNYVLPSSADGVHQHTGLTDAQGVHVHGGATDGQGSHAHNVTAYLADVGPGTRYAGGGFVGGNQNIVTDVQGFHAHNIATDAQGNHAHNLSTYAGQGSHSHTITLGGSGVVLRVVPMYLAVTKIIYAGVAVGTVVPSGQTGAKLLAAPARGMN
jgi:microcystin-dependent protein